MPDFTWKAGDTAPPLSDTLTYSDGTPVNLSGKTVQLVLRSLTAAQPLKLTGAVTIVNATAGEVTFTPSSADTAVPGTLQGNWVVTGSSVSMTFPTRGYLWGVIEENLTTAGGQQLVSLGDVKEYMKIPANDRTWDDALTRAIRAARPMIESVCGPIIPQTFEEWHDGGNYFIRLRRRPATGYGTTPTLTLLACSEYRGPIEYTLQIVRDPAHGTIYSCMLDPRLGTVTRRSSGGGVIAFPQMAQAVHVVYEAGQHAVPDNVYEGTLELIRVNYQETMMVGSGRYAEADVENTGPPLGFYMPRKVREMIAPTRRAPSIA